jgi:flagellar basal body P-ring protein FlgI
MFSLFFSKYGKMITLVVTILGGVGSILAVVKFYETKGYTRATTEIQAAANEEIAKATAKAIKDHKVKVTEALEDQRIRFEAKLEQAKLERIVNTEIKEVIRYVDKIKIDPNCVTVSDDILRVLNQTTSAANRTNN